METTFTNCTGERRKALVHALSELLGAEPRYLGMPSAAYQVGGVTVSPTGTVTGELSAETLQTLAARGFEAESQEDEIPQAPAFDSDAKEIQYHAKRILADGTPRSAKELKAASTAAAGRDFSVGAFAVAFRELVESDCRYATDGRGIYRFADISCDGDLLPFASIVATAKNKLITLRHKSLITDQRTSDRVSRAIEILDALVGDLLSE